MNKPTIIPITSFILGALLLGPFISFAATRTRVAPDQFCTSLPTLEEKLLTEASTRKSDFAKRVSGQIVNLTNQRQDLAGKVTTERDSADTSRVLMYSKIDALATTPEKLRAAQEFKTTLDSALTDRRNSVDSAINTYQDNLASLVKSRADESTRAMDIYNNTLKDVFHTAENSCSNGTNPKSIRVDLKKNIENTRATLKASVASLDIKKSLEQLVSTRSTAIANSTKAYQSAFDQAKAKLQSILK